MTKIRPALATDECLKCGAGLMQKCRLTAKDDHCVQTSSGRHKFSSDSPAMESMDDADQMYAVDLTASDLQPFTIPQGYSDLHGILQDAFDQSAHGKGKERHAGRKPFDRQPIMEIGRMVGPGYAIGQLMKKAQEAMTMQTKEQFDAAERELLGVIVYAAAAVKLIREHP